MAHIRKHKKKWQAIVKRKNLRVQKSFVRKSDASKWAYRTEAQIETGTYRRVQEAERIADIRICEVLNIYYEKHLKKKSSVLGLVSLPFSSAYNATKFAMEAFARSLRLELKNTNIKVSLIEPGPIEANFNINALKNLKRLNINNSVYKERYYKMMKYLEEGNNFFTLPALSVAKKVYTALKSKKPKTQYFVTLPTYIMSYLRILPNPVFENLLVLLNNHMKKNQD